MYKEKKICVVVPAYNEELLIQNVVRTMPSFVDKIIVVNDSSTDATLCKLEELLPIFKNKLSVVSHEVNSGVGASITTGYKESLRLGMDISCVMAGDAQMDPEELPLMIEPIISGAADYVKGNRLNRYIFYPTVNHVKPHQQIIGITVSLIHKVKVNMLQYIISYGGVSGLRIRDMPIT